MVFPKPPLTWKPEEMLNKLIFIPRKQVIVKKKLLGLQDPCKPPVAQALPESRPRISLAKALSSQPFHRLELGGVRAERSEKNTPRPKKKGLVVPSLGGMGLSPGTKPKPLLPHRFGEPDKGPVRIFRPSGGALDQSSCFVQDHSMDFLTDKLEAGRKASGKLSMGDLEASSVSSGGYFQSVGLKIKMRSASAKAKSSKDSLELSEENSIHTESHGGHFNFTKKSDSLQLRGRLKSESKTNSRFENGISGMIKPGSLHSRSGMASTGVSKSVIAASSKVPKTLPSHLTTQGISINKQQGIRENLSKLDYRKIKGIPCLLLPPQTKSDSLLIFYHANGEDIGRVESLCASLATRLKMWVLAPEYPGYSIYQSKSSSEEQILEDAHRLLSHLTHSLSISPSHIFLMGRSLGCAPALHLASLHPVGGLICLSPFTSLRDASKDMLGNILGGVLKERFTNLKKIPQVKSPCLFIHGKKDKMIPYSHSVRLYGSFV